MKIKNAAFDFHGSMFLELLLPGDYFHVRVEKQ